jgi:DNA-binding NtrC family response regulator
MLPIEGTLIVVEDDPILRTLITDILVEIGAQSLAFETADDALTYLLQNPAHCPLVIVDQGLPGQIQGIEFIEMIQSRWPSIGCILTSGYLIDPSELPAHIIYLHKPWSLDDLVTAVASILQPDVPIFRTTSQ